MKRTVFYILLTALVPLLFSGCREEYEIFDDLAVTSHTLNIAQTPGKTHIAVYSTGAWTVAFDQPVDWASLDRLSGNGLGDFVLSWSANFGTTRSLDILVSRDDLTERITVIQTGSVTTPYISFDRTKVALPRQKTTFSVPLATNLNFSRADFKARAIYYDDPSHPDTLEIGAPSKKAWISAYKVLEDRFDFTVEANDSKMDRNASVVCYLVDASGKEIKSSLSVLQSESDPVFTLDSSVGMYYANEKNLLVPAPKNNIWSMDGVSVTADAPWVQDLAVTEEGLSFHIGENEDGDERSATITVSYTSPEGLKAGCSFYVSQGGDRMLSFEELRARVPGAIRGPLLLEGFVLSDADCPNVCSSPQTGQFEFDRTENTRTAYIESTDAAYGLCLKFTSAAENKLQRGSKVIVRLDGLVLERASAPLRYTLSGVTADRIARVNDNSAVPEKRCSIAQLTDADIYTFVTLQDMEILCKDGCYTNASEGYCLQDELNPLGATMPRWDVAPLLCSDASGNAISMLTNAAAPWRRTGKDVAWYSCLPQGSGTISGVIVSDAVAPVRWGNLGRYQIRPMDVTDLQLDQPAFSNIICEWNWNDGVEKLTPDVGKGSFQKYEAATRFVQDYNNPYLPTEDTPNGYGTSNMKGLVSGGAICLTQSWWDFELNEGKYFDVEFSTAGLSGTNLVFGIVWGHGLGSSSTVYGPSHWNVLYSTDGNNFNPVPSAGILKQRSCAWWNNPQTSQDATPGYTEHLVKLPSSCFGRNKVIVRLQVADTTTDIVPTTGASIWPQALGIEKGTLSPSSNGPVRIGTITVRFN